MRRLLSGATRLMLILEILHAVAYTRFIFLRHLRRRLAVAAGTHPAVAKNALEHNLRGMRRSIRRVGRSTVLIRPLSVIPRIHRDLVDTRVLSIGPRSEAELLCLAAYGFRWSNITGVDLFSYSPRIDVGDMHALTYADDSFDVVIASRVLGYSNAPEFAAGEMVRVARPGALIAINVGDRQPGNPSATDLDYQPGGDRVYASVHDVLALFGDHVGHVYFSSDPSLETGSRRGPILAIFAVRK